MKIFSVLAKFVLWEFSIVSSLSWYSILVQHACNDHPWLTSETCQCLLAGRELFSCWICNKSRKNHLTKSQSDIFNLQKVILFIFIQLIWQILKQLSHSGSVNSARYIPWRFGSPCISTTIHLPFGGYLHTISFARWNPFENI